MRPCGSPTALECHSSQGIPPSTCPRPSTHLWHYPDYPAGTLLRIVDVKHSRHAPRAVLSLVHVVAPTTTAARIAAMWTWLLGHKVRRHSVRSAGSLKWHISHIAPVTTANQKQLHQVCIEAILMP